MKPPSLWSPDAPLRRLILEAGLHLAAVHRRRLRGVKFIAVTGGSGKTTTKELVAGVLGSELNGNLSPGWLNRLTDVGLAVLRTGPSHAFCVIEVAAWEPGSIERAARVVRPDIAVVLNVNDEHCDMFGTIDATAREKSRLLSSMTPGGVAVLNLDDPYVKAMAEAYGGRVITVGTGPGATMRARDLRSAWPERLSFVLEYEGRSLPVQTRMCGKHWVSSVLAVLGVAVAMELPLDRAIETLAALDPYPGRMSPVELGGVSFIRDDKKALRGTVEPALEFLADAHAARKIAVIGKIIEFGANRVATYRSIAGRALEVADVVVFGGPDASEALGGPGGSPERLHVFASMDEAREHVVGMLRPGDLVLLKGGRSADKLIRIIRAYVEKCGVAPSRPATVRSARSLPTRGDMDQKDTQQPSEPLVELAPDEAVVRALFQSAYPVEWVESNSADAEVAEPDAS